MELRRLSRVLPYIWYPASFTAAIACFGLLLRFEYPPALAAYLPTVFVGLVIILLEFHFPEREEWRPRWEDVKADAAFLALVQIFLPQALAAVSIIAIATWMHEREAYAWWPHHWPLAVQVAVVVLAVDFMRYWLHRACHHFMPLWKLHEVHHSPEILYVLNVGRFHPFEKTLHFALDTVPFLLLGVGPEVIAGYFLMYSVNGLFQHCNVKLRYGWLNYIVGSAETHRWHHARDPQTAACNFGNTTIMWDLLFGTWRLYPEKVEVGIMDTAYPQAFWAQVAAPFQREYRVRRPPWQRWVVGPLSKAWFWTRQWWLNGWTRASLHDPMQMQRAVLKRILRKNERTSFGRRHGFEAIADEREFAARVPVHTYEELRPGIAAEIEGGETALTTEVPRTYARTSGTTGAPKDVPLVDEHLRALSRVHEASLLFQQRACPEAFAGGVLGIVGARAEGVMPNGRIFGSASGLVAAGTSWLIRSRFVVPPEVFAVEDSRLKYLLILRLAITRRDLTYIGCANPTTLLALIRLYRENAARLLSDVRDGTFFLRENLSPDVDRAVRSGLRAHAGRAAELAALGEAAAVRIADLWPELRAVSTWTCASAGIAATALRKELRPDTRVLELGYIASEFRGTITIGRRAESGLPTFDTHYFEFVERERWERGEPEFLTLDRLRRGVDYYIVATTPSGLYRYFINDLVRVTGWLHRTPLLQFLQKGRGVTNITGEKLYEMQVLAAVGRVLQSRRSSARFFMMLADEEAFHYTLNIEIDGAIGRPSQGFAAEIDEALQRTNIEYAAKRESRRLGDVRVVWLEEGTGEAFKAFYVSRGQREGQFKTVALDYRRNVKFDFAAHERKEIS